MPTKLLRITLLLLVCSAPVFAQQCAYVANARPENCQLDGIRKRRGDANAVWFNSGRQPWEKPYSFCQRVMSTI